jgi:hypothetical protein
MGYELFDSRHQDMRLAGADLTVLRNNMEHRFDLLAGEWLGENTSALMYRFGYLFGPEQRLKIELQPTWWRRTSEENWLLSLCFSALVTADLTFRTMYEYNRDEEDHRTIVQLYYYLPL